MHQGPLLTLADGGNDAKRFRVRAYSSVGFCKCPVWPDILTKARLRMFSDSKETAVPILTVNKVNQMQDYRWMEGGISMKLQWQDEHLVQEHKVEIRLHWPGVELFGEVRASCACFSPSWLNHQKARNGTHTSGRGKRAI